MSAKTFSITVKPDSWRTISHKDAILQEIDLNDLGIQFMKYQEEDDGQPHLQGIIQMTQRKSVRQMLQMFDVLGIPEVHVEKARDVNALYHYVQKVESKVPGGASLKKGHFIGSGRLTKETKPSVTYEDAWNFFQEGGHPNNIVDTLGPNALKLPYKNIYTAYLEHKRQKQQESLQEIAEEWWTDQAWTWQKEARALLEEWSEEEEDRKILVVYDPEGNNGKTQFCKYLQNTNPSQIAYIKKSKLNDMSFILKNYDDLKICLVDYTRDDENWGSPKFLESLKDGIVQSNKYHSEVLRFPNVQVAVMTNKELHWNTLTKDRWAIYELFGKQGKAEFAEWGKRMRKEKFEGQVEPVDPYGDGKKCKYTDRNN